MEPVIKKIEPSAALPGGEVFLEGEHFMVDGSRPTVSIDNLAGHFVVCAGQYGVVVVPPNASHGEVKLVRGSSESKPVRLRVASLLAGNLHSVSNPAVDEEGNIYATFSGSRGQKVPTSVFKITPDGVIPYLSELMNATGMAFNSRGELFVSSRFDGTVYKVRSRSQMEVYAKGMGVATGLVFDREDNLFVGDRSGTIFKIDPERRTFVFATLEPSVSAYHLALDARGFLYVTGPTIGCLDSVYRISHQGDVEKYYLRLGRPQGMVIDRRGNLLVAASLAGRKGVVQIRSDRTASPVVAGTGIVGLALDPSREEDLILATADSIYRLKLD
ncbi:MAG: gluconolaconase [Acidobacteriia bacterium]|nr:gluconolaconase [Terriglobia bacterium]